MSMGQKPTRMLLDTQTASLMLAYLHDRVRAFERTGEANTFVQEVAGLFPDGDQLQVFVIACRPDTVGSALTVQTVNHLEELLGLAQEIGGTPTCANAPAPRTSST